MASQEHEQGLTGLILSGGGARAAYQVGVLAAIADLLPNAEIYNPFPVIVGTSARLSMPWAWPAVRYISVRLSVA